MKGKQAPAAKEEEEKGDLLTRDIWNQRINSIYGMRVVNTDSVSYQFKTP